MSGAESCLLKGEPAMEKKASVYEYNPKRVMIIYLLTCAFCMLVFFVYNIFSHGVLSFFMTFLFLWPLVLGVIPAFVLYLAMKGRHVFLPSRIPARLWRSGVASITMASLLKGIFDIAGTDSVHTVVLFLAGVLFLCFGGILFLKVFTLLQTGR